MRLTRSHPSCPWGVVISGTDDVVDAPVYIDSLTPGKPAALSGLLQRGDRILAVNGLEGAAPKLAGGTGLTLSLVTARLQQPFESVTLYIAREKGRTDFQLPSSSSAVVTSSLVNKGNASGVGIVKQHSWGTVSTTFIQCNVQSVFGKFSWLKYLLLFYLCCMIDLHLQDLCKKFKKKQEK